jgi:hypothetical protein
VKRLISRRLRDREKSLDQKKSSVRYFIILSLIKDRAERFHNLSFDIRHSSFQRFSAFFAFAIGSDHADTVAVAAQNPISPFIIVNNGRSVSSSGIGQLCFCGG